MPRTRTQPTERILLSAPDQELLDFFSLRRTLDGDGSIKYVQLIGDPALLEAASKGENLSSALAKGKSGSRGSYSLPRMIGGRILGRPLMSNEVVVPLNGKNADCRRSNLEVTTRSEMASSTPRKSWSRTGAKYVYGTPTGKFYAQIGDHNLGTYETVADAREAVETFQTMVDAGVPPDEARLRVINRGRNSGRFVVSE